jgi:selenocysteine lyase/cysteine desulfurase
VTTISSREFRTHFPSIHECAYFATCSLGACSILLEDAVDQMLIEMMKPLLAWEAFEHCVSTLRELVGSFLGTDTDRVAVVPNATIGAYQAATSIDWRARPKIVACTAEFPSISRVWQAQSTRGATTMFISGNSPVDVITNAYLTAIDNTTGLVSIPACGFLHGQRFPVPEIAAAAHRAGARVFVDAFQLAGTEPLAPITTAADYVVFGFSKYLLGLPGVAALYTADPGHGDPDPVLTGWMGAPDPFGDGSGSLVFSDTARRYETGTPAIPAVYAAVAGLRLLGMLPPATIRDHIETLTESAAAHLYRAGFDVCSPRSPHQRGPMIAVRHPNAHLLAKTLQQRQIVTSPRADTVRFAFHYYNTSDDIERLAAALQE